MEFQSVILAAGKGTRMNSERPKVLHEVLGRPMIGHAVRAALNAGAERVVSVVGYGRRDVESWLDSHEASERIAFAVQDDQLGTGHAVWAAESYLRDGPEYTLITYGDVPLVKGETLEAFVQTVHDSGRPLGVMTARVDDPSGYGRILRRDDGDVFGIVEETDTNPQQAEIDEINAGLYVARTDFLLEALPQIIDGSPDNAQDEYYLTDLVEIAAGQPEGGVFGFPVDNPADIKGVNTRADLADATGMLRRRINRRWMDEGVTIVDPTTTFIEPGVELGRDVVLQPGVHLRGETEIGDGTLVEDGSVIRDSTIGADVHVKPHCVIEESSVDSNTSLGPSAHLRPGADIGSNCKVGNFVEVKKARLDDGVKAGHLAYIGDAHLGARTNVGAGTITCNYDGQDKHLTETGEDVFIGSNASLVAPVRLGDGAYVGAGSTITEDVPSKALAVARGRQRNIEGWADEQDEE